MNFGLLASRNNTQHIFVNVIKLVGFNVCQPVFRKFIRLSK